VKVAILGAGKFGRVIYRLCQANAHSIKVWNRSAVESEALVPIPNLTTNLEVCLADADIVFFVVSSSGMTALLSQVVNVIPKQAICISCIKGLASNGEPMMQLFAKHLPNHNYGVISGPNLATEIIEGKIASTVIASSDSHVCETVQQLLSSNLFRVYSSSDVIGVEWGGILKNIYAIAFGICEQLDLGENAKGSLIARSLAEMIRFGTAMGATERTFIGLSGVGDLFTTSTSTLSRNFRLGHYVASGLTTDEALIKIKESVEGLPTVKTIFEQSKSIGIAMPINEALYRILYQGNNAIDELKLLMAREQTSEL